MTPDELYKKGYGDGAHGVAANATHITDPNYMSGYKDGQADADMNMVVRGAKRPYTDPDFPKLNAPPEGYHWTGEHRTPQKGEIYYTKAGNAGVAKSDPKNGRKRHILQAQSKCWRAACKFTMSHPGNCSDRLIK